MHIKVYAIQPVLLKLMTLETVLVLIVLQTV
jgi:hypothetical protein